MYTSIKRLKVKVLGIVFRGAILKLAENEVVTDARKSQNKSPEAGADGKRNKSEGFCQNGKENPQYHH